MRAVASATFVYLLLTLPAQALRAQADPSKNSDSGIVTAAQTPADEVEAAWKRLEKALSGSSRLDTRLAGVNALSLLGGLPRADILIRESMQDKDADVQLASIVAAGEMARVSGPNNELQGALRSLLNGSDPRVVYTAASTLWKLNDPSGEDILEAVAQGERSGDYSFCKNIKHAASRDLHSPAALAKIGATQGAMMLVPPIGIGMGAYNYLKGSGGGTSPQVTAITQLSHEHTAPVREALINATTTKDTGAKLAAIEALAYFPGNDVRRPGAADDRWKREPSPLRKRGVHTRGLRSPSSRAGDREACAEPQKAQPVSTNRKVRR